jgi:plastocyanin
MNKQSLAALVLCIATAIALTACGSASVGSASVGSNNLPGSADATGNPAVHMQNTTFAQPAITIQAGQSVTLIADTYAPHKIANGTWENAVAKPAREQGAPTVADLEIPDHASGTIGPFTTAGTFQFYCILHAKMNLAVVVN